MTKYINKLGNIDLRDLERLLIIEDEVIYNWYFEINSNNSIPNTKISTMLKKFKL